MGVQRVLTDPSSCLLDSLVGANSTVNGPAVPSAPTNEWFCSPAASQKLPTSYCGGLRTASSGLCSVCAPCSEHPLSAPPRARPERHESKRQPDFDRQQSAFNGTPLTGREPVSPRVRWNREVFFMRHGTRLNPEWAPSGVKNPPRRGSVSRKPS